MTKLVPGRNLPSGIQFGSTYSKLLASSTGTTVNGPAFTARDILYCISETITATPVNRSK